MRLERSRYKKKLMLLLGISLILTVVFKITVPVVVSAEDSNKKDEIIQSSKRSESNQKSMTQFPFVEGEVLVKFKGKSLDTTTLQKHGLKVKEFLGDNIAILELPKYQKTNNLVNTLSTENTIIEVQPNYIYNPTSISNDPHADKMWGLNNTGQSIFEYIGKKDMDINLPEAWNLIKDKTLNEVVVAVIDTGVQTSHPDLIDNIWVNDAELNGEPGVDDDNNGYIDDIYGYDFYHNDGSVFDSEFDDDHGTHVAGTIAASTNNNLGIVGIAPNVKIMSLKFLGPDGGYTSDAIRAIEYAKKMGVKISNNSWGGVYYDRFLKEAIEESGMLFVAAAGNDGWNNDTYPHYPSNYTSSNILSVAAINNKGNLAYFSNYGRQSVDIVAPGEDILSTVPGTYAYLSGTSMAAPHVTGVAALAMGITENLSPEKLIEQIKKTGKTVTGASLTASGKMIDAEKLIENITPVYLKLEELYNSTHYIKGETLPYAKVTVKDVNNKIVSSLTADKAGKFSIRLSAIQQEGTKFYITSEMGINVSEIVELKVLHDTVKPELQEPLLVSNIKTTIDGVVSEEATINVKISNKQFVGKTDQNGKFKITIGSQIAGTQGTIEISDKATPANTTKIDFVVKDGIAPIIKKVNSVYDTSVYIEGEVNESSKITLFTSTDNKNWIQLNNIEIVTNNENKFAYELEATLVKGSKVKVVAIDSDFNSSKDSITTILQDRKAPLLIEPKTISMNDSEQQTIKGKLDERGTIEVKKAGNTIVGPLETKKDGSFEVIVPEQKPNEKVTFIFKDVVGNKVEKTVTVQDGTKPVIENVSNLYNTGKTLEGKVSEQATVSALVKGKVVGTMKTDTQGNFTLTFKQRFETGTKVELKATDYAKPKALVSDVMNVIVEKDTISPKLLSIIVADNSTTVTGKVSEEATVELRVGEKLLTKKTVSTDIYGNFKITITKQFAGTKITVTLVDYGENKTETEVTVEDKTVPIVKKVNPIYDTSIYIEGEISESSKINIFTSTDNKNWIQLNNAESVTNNENKFAYELDAPLVKGSKVKVVAIDNNLNASQDSITTILQDRKAPILIEPKIISMNDSEQQIIKGKLDERGTVEVKKAGTIIIGPLETKKDGSFEVIVPKQKPNEKVTFIFIDVVGNKVEKIVTVQDGTKPVIENVSNLYNTGKTLEGKISEQATVSALVNGKVVGTVKTDTQGNFTLTFKQRFETGTKVELKATDYAKPKALVSDVVNVIVEKDTISPELLSITVADNSTIVTGKVSEEATVELKVGEKLLTKKPVNTDINGNFKIAIAKQLADTNITVTLVDYGENKTTTEVTVEDKTLPTVKKINPFYHITSSKISGIISESSTVSVYYVDSKNKLTGSPIVTGSTDVDGNFEIALEEQAINTKLAVLAVDAAGNTSTPKIVTVLKDRVAPTLKLENIYTDSTEIEGVLSEQGNVTVKFGSITLTENTNSNNLFTVALDEYLSKGTRVSITAEDIVGNKRTSIYTVKATPTS